MTDPDYRQRALDTIKSLDPISPKMLSFAEQLQIATIYAILGVSDPLRGPGAVELDRDGDSRANPEHGGTSVCSCMADPVPATSDRVRDDPLKFTEVVVGRFHCKVPDPELAHKSSSQSEGAATPGDDTVEEPADEGGQAGWGTSQPRSAPADLTPRGICFEYRQDVNHRYWIERDGKQYAATVQQDVLPGEHTVIPIDGPDKHFTDLDKAIAWAKNHILDAADQARKEQP